MGMVQVTLTENHQLSEESINRLTALEERPIDFSDIPEYSTEEMLEMRRMAIEKRKKQLFSLRLQKGVICWWKQNIGDGYTGVMARLLEEAPKHPEWIKECL